jgi:hypothetical protein
MEMNCKVVESCDDLFCGDWQKWKKQVCEKVWQIDQDNVFFINEENRRKQIIERAYSIWEKHGGSPEANWLQAEIEVDMALFD